MPQKVLKSKQRKRKMGGKKNVNNTVKTIHLRKYNINYFTVFAFFKIK